MPADTDRKHAQHQQRSVLLRSDQDSGMALVKSKDGRTKWLTVRYDMNANTTAAYCCVLPGSRYMIIVILL